MQALIIDREADRLDNSLIALMNAGVHVTGTRSIEVAEICITRLGVDLLVLEKSSIGDALGDTIGMAEERNPFLVSILRTPDVAADLDALSPHFQSLHCVVGLDVPNSMAVRIGLASLRGEIARAANGTDPLPVAKWRDGAAQPVLSKRPKMPYGALAEAV